MEEKQKQTTMPQDKSGTKTSESESDQEYFKIVKPLRTYERDIAESLRKKDASKASIHLEEQESGKQEKPQEGKPFPFKKFLIVGIVLIMLLAGGLMIFWLLQIINSPAPQITAPQIESLIRSDSIKTFNIEGRSGEEILSFVRETFQSSLPAENPKLIQFQFTGADSMSKTQGIRPENLFEILIPEAPAVLKRSLGSKANYGFLAEAETIYPFLITELESFENSFASMLSWEKTIAEDLENLISNPSEGAEGTTEINFEDAVIRNKDVRILKDSSGNSVILYSFLDRNTLLIAQNEETFREILDRFLVKQLSS